MNPSKPLFSAIFFLAFSTPVAAQATAAGTRQADTEYQSGAVLWMQTAGEARALQYQAYYLARLELERDLRARRRDARRRAVVVDVDETVLDNSRYQATLVWEHRAYDGASWTAWCNREEATAVPGAVEFLQYAARRGVRVFYITNRRIAEKNATEANLKKLGFPDVTDATLLVRTDGSSKEGRRQEVGRRYRLVLLIGDNLNDFADVFEGKSVEERKAAVETARTKFGSRFIVLPNPMYGDWESAIYGYNQQLSDEERASRRRSALIRIGN